jgi:hypothetical protein
MVRSHKHASLLLQPRPATPDEAVRKHHEPLAVRMEETRGHGRKRCGRARDPGRTAMPSLVALNPTGFDGSLFSAIDWYKVKLLPFSANYLQH